MSYTLTLYERETIINFNEADAVAGIYTHNIALSNKLLKLSQTESDLRIVRQTSDSLEVEVPKKWIRVSPPKKLSTESKQTAIAATRRQSSFFMFYPPSCSKFSFC